MEQTIIDGELPEDWEDEEKIHDEEYDEIQMPEESAAELFINSMAIIENE